MAAQKTATAARKMQSGRFAAGLSLLVLTALGILVWGNNIKNIAILGIAWVAVVGSAYLFAMKYLGQKMVGKAERDRDGNEGDAPRQRSSG